MARKTPKSRRTPVTARTPVRTATWSQSGGAATIVREEPVLASDEVATIYGHVRRDLMRIAVLAVALFAVIVAARFIL